jgi:hypothetical protein
MDKDTETTEIVIKERDPYNKIFDKVVEDVGKNSLKYISEYGDVEAMTQFTKKRNNALGRLYYEFLKGTGRNGDMISELEKQASFDQFYDTVPGERQYKGAFAYPVSYREYELNQELPPAETLEDFLEAWKSKRLELTEKRKSSRGIGEEDLPGILTDLFTRSIAMSSAQPHGEKWTRDFIKIVNKAADNAGVKAVGTVRNTRKIFVESLLRLPETLNLICERALPVFNVVKAAGGRFTPKEVFDTSEFLDIRINDINWILEGTLEGARENNDTNLEDKIRGIIENKGEQKEVIDL